MIILASASAARRAMMEAAGLKVTVDVAAIDEDAVKQGMRQGTGNPARVAEVLAELKATRVSARHPEAVVIGADQMLDCDGQWFDKPTSRDEARRHLLDLRHRTHRLTSAVVVVRNGQRLWHHVEAATLTMRNFSESFLDEYLDRVGPAVFTSVGAYQLEGLGAQLFSRIEGDFFTILGLPLLPLLDVLRENGELPQ
jgi:septum formation protein